MGKYCKNYDECAHFWAHRVYDSGYSRGDRMYFNGDVIYSYGSHHRIAQMYDDLDIILFNNDTYSATTAKHHGIVRRAISHRRVLYVPEVDVIAKLKRGAPNWKKEDWETKHCMNLEYFVNNITEASDRLSRARKEHTKDMYVETIYTARRNFNAYVGVFGLVNTAKRYKKLRGLLDLDLSDAEKLTKDANEERERYRAREKRKRAAALRKRIKKAKEELALWLKGERAHTYDLHMLGTTYLRIKDDMVETDQNASVPLKQARIMYKRLKAGKDIQGHKIGYYKIDKVTDKQIVIGCHNIPVSEVRRVLDA